MMMMMTTTTMMMMIQRISIPKDTNGFVSFQGEGVPTPSPDSGCFYSLLVQSHFIQTWEAGRLMDADNVILLDQCLMPVCISTIGFLGQGRGQRSWSGKSPNFLNFCTLYLLSAKRDQIQESFNISVNKILNKNMLFYKHKNQSTESNVNNLD